MKSDLGDNEQNNKVKSANSGQGISLYFGKLKIHLDPVEILFICLLFLPIGIMIRDAPQTSFEDAMKRVAIVMGAITGIRTLPTDKFYERLLSISLDGNKDKKDDQT